MKYGELQKIIKIQPAEFVNKNKLLFAEGNAIKYICRMMESLLKI